MATTEDHFYSRPLFDWDAPPEKTIIKLEDVYINGNSLDKMIGKPRNPKNKNGDFMAQALQDFGFADSNAFFRGGESGGASGNRSQLQKNQPVADANSSPSDMAANNPYTCNPVILATGEKYKIEHDITSGGGYGLSLSRTYKSFSKNTRMFGVRWHSSYDYAPLKTSGCFRHSDYPNKCMPVSVGFSLPDGSNYTYTSKGAAYDFTYRVKNSSAMGLMTYDPDTGYLIRTASGTYRYSPIGVIQSVTTPGGSSLLQFTYATHPKLPSRVSNAAGSFVDFTYNSDWYVSAATDAAGNQWTYQYTNVNLLTTVTSPGSSPDVRTYFYVSHPGRS